MELKVAFMHRKGLCRGQVSWLFLGSGMLDFQRLALLGKLASLLYFGGNIFDKGVRKNN